MGLTQQLLSWPKCSARTAHVERALRCSLVPEGQFLLHAAKNSHLDNQADWRVTQCVDFAASSEQREIQGKKPLNSDELKFSHIPPVFSAGFRFQMKHR